MENWPGMVDGLGLVCIITLNIMLGGYQLPLASAWGYGYLSDLGFSPGLKIKVWLKPNQKGKSDPRAKARGN